MPSTTWRDDDGNWTITNNPTPMCFRCISKQEKRDTDTDTTMVRSEMRLETVPGTQQLYAVCPVCKHAMYREVS